MMPPARCTSSRCTSALAGATLHSTGTRRDRRSMSAMVKLTSRLIRGGEQVQHGVGRAAHGDVERHRVLESLEIGDGARQHGGVILLVPAPREIDDRVAGLDEQALAVRVGRQSGAIARQAKAQRLDQAVHAELAVNMPEHEPQVGQAERSIAFTSASRVFVIGGGDHGVDEIERLSLAVQHNLAGLHRAAGNEDRREC